jgi:hypothetical protein
MDPRLKVDDDRGEVESLGWGAWSDVAAYRLIRVDRMIDDSVRSTPSIAPMRSIR